MAKRLFLGIALDKQQRRQIGQLQSRFDADVKCVSAKNLHMTLAFFGLVSSAVQRKLEKRLSAMHKPKFSITLTSLVYWEKPKILCITGEAKDRALLQIVNDTHLLASILALPLSAQRYQAHITLARKAHGMPHCPAPHLHVKELEIHPPAIHLFESKNAGNGVDYQILASWDLH